MLNRSGIKKTSYGNQKQILANVELQSSVGCIVPQSIGVIVGAKKIAKAGTPVNINLKNTATAVTAATTTCNAVLLHDVDVTEGSANGTALVFGFVNLNRVEADVLTKLNAITDSGMVTLMAV
jgi:hypothetical protein